MHHPRALRPVGVCVCVLSLPVVEVHMRPACVCVPCPGRIDLEAGCQTF